MAQMGRPLYWTETRMLRAILAFHGRYHRWPLKSDFRTNRRLPDRTTLYRHWHAMAAVITAARAHVCPRPIWRCQCRARTVECTCSAYHRQRRTPACGVCTQTGGIPTTQWEETSHGTPKGLDHGPDS